MSTDKDSFLGELRLGRQLSTGGQVAAVGLAIAGGLLFLISDAVLLLAGPLAILAVVLAMVAIGLTLLSLAELLAGSSERGSSFVLIQETLGGWGAFLAGWFILAGCVVLSAAMAQAAAHHLLLLFPTVVLPAVAIAGALVVLLILVHAFQPGPRRALLWPSILALMVGLAIVVLSALPGIRLGQRAGPSSVGLPDLLRAAAWLITGYAALEAILTSRRQVADPQRRMLPAMVAVLVVGGLAFGVLTLVTPWLDAPSWPDSELVASRLMEASPLPSWIGGGLAFALLTLATSGCLMLSVRQLHNMSREGGLPPSLRRLRRPFRVPPLLFAVILVLSLLVAVFASTELLTDLAAGSFLVAMILLNVAAIYSHRTEPERRRTLVVPFFPLVPALAIGLSVALFAALPLMGLLGTAVWLILGLLFYAVYGRRQQAAALEGVSVFGSERIAERGEGAFRILVPLGGGEERHLLLRMAMELAFELNGEVIPLQVIQVADPLALEEGRRLAAERNVLFQWSIRVAEQAGVPVFPITRLARSVPEGIIDTTIEEGCDLILMPWVVAPASPGTRMGRVLDRVVRGAPCDVAVLAFDPRAGQAERAEGGTPLHVSRILVPTAGGPHAPLATRLAISLARGCDADITAIYVITPEQGPDQRALGEERIQSTLEAMRRQSAALRGHESREPLPHDISIESRVVESTGVVRGIVDTAREYDLVFIGASNERLIDQVLFGTVPEQIARSSLAPVVMVKHYRGLPRFWLQRTWDALFSALPTLSREEQLEVNRQIRIGARPASDFFVMMALAAVIATLGLLQNSAAVIIGAMLVAPLFTPILALSLGIVQGHARLLGVAVEAALKGIALAIGVSVLLAAISPLNTVTPEIIARTRPNLFDLAVALASGAAGAYALARKNVAASLPGVAIAAALVPPLTVVGIGLATGDPSVAGGAALLFATNLIAIVMAGAVTLLLLGFRPAPRDEHEARLRLGLVATVLMLLIITIPLTLVFAQSVSATRTRSVIEDTLSRELEPLSGVRLAGFEFTSDRRGVQVDLTLYSARSLTRAEGARLSSELSKSLGKPAQLLLVTIPVTEMEVEAR